MRHFIYLDHAATTGVRREVLQAMLPYFSDCSGNPSSVYRYGECGRQAVTQARQTIAGLLRAGPEEIVFTSGGTEADNWVIKNAVPPGRQGHSHLITTAIEHHAVLNSCRYLEQNGCRVTYLQPDTDGLISPRQVQDAICPDTVLISVMYANNEIGTIQPIRAIGAVAQAAGIPLHTDAVQALGQLPIELDILPVTYLSASAHKLHGPKGTGLLYMRGGHSLPPLIHGGAQEYSLRAGTENVPGIVGFAKALSCMYSGMDARFRRLTALRDFFAGLLLREIPDCRINGSMTSRLPGNLNVTFPGADASSLLMLLDMEGISASGGSACSARDSSPSHVLTAIGLSPELARSTVRFTLGEENTREELIYTCRVLRRAVASLRGLETS